MKGLLRYLRYGFAPNQLHYCGPRDSKAILDYLKAGRPDEGLRQLLEEFKGALPYLKFIARQNGRADYFDEQVVEAYWLGNDLLLQCDLKDFYADLRQRFGKMVSPRVLELMLAGVPKGAVPHHSFHVLQVFSQTGGMEKYFKPSLEMMNQCLIRSGKILKPKTQNLKLQLRTQKLVYKTGRLRLAPSAESVRILDGVPYKQGDWVSLHWGWVCEKITPAQKERLDFWTRWNWARTKWWL